MDKYSTLEKIFKQVGYTISSNFMDTDMFKKLVWLLAFMLADSQF